MTTTNVYNSTYKTAVQTSSILDHQQSYICTHSNLMFTDLAYEKKNRITILTSLGIQICSNLLPEITRLFVPSGFISIQNFAQPLKFLSAI
jgi:hypothetical protein